MIFHEYFGDLFLMQLSLNIFIFA